MTSYSLEPDILLIICVLSPLFLREHNYLPVWCAEILKLPVVEFYTCNRERYSLLLGDNSSSTNTSTSSRIVGDTKVTQTRTVTKKSRVVEYSD